MDNWSFISSDDMHAQVQCSADMVNGRLSRLGVDGRVLEHDIGIGMFYYSKRVFNLESRKWSNRLFALYKFEGFVNIKSVWVHGEAMTACCNASDGIGDVIFRFEQILFTFEQARKSASNVTESDEGEVVVH